MKIVKIFLIILIVVTALYSCSDPDFNAQFCVTNNLGANIWVCLGTYDTVYNTYHAVSGWVYTADGNTSSYVSFEPGTYYVCYDWDSDHSGIQEPIAAHEYSMGLSYTLEFASNGDLNITP